MKKLLLLFILSGFFLFSVAQVTECPRGEIDCPGKCGLFIDNNGDGFCDLGKLSSNPENTKEETTPKTSTQQEQKNAPPAAKQFEMLSANVKQETELPTGDTVSTATAHPAVSDTVSDEVKKTEEKNSSKHKSPYLLVPILMILLSSYILTIFLVNKKIIRLAMHRKIWNIALTGTFLVTGILGLIMAFMINYGHLPGFYRTLLKFHVDFGIGMAVIAIFHLLWHLNYYKTILKFKKRK